MYAKINSLMNTQIKYIAILVMSIVYFSTLQSCSLFSGAENKTAKPIADTHEQDGFVNATIINYSVDGCTFMIQLKGGKKLEPVNLKDEFKKDNLKVWVKYQHYKGNSICMAGEMVTIISMVCE